MKSMLVAAAALALLALPASAAEVVKLPHFDGIGVHGGGHVILRTGPVQKVTVLKGSTQVSRVEVNDSGGLEISPCKSWWSCPHQVELEVEVITPSITALAVHGGGAITAAGNFAPQMHLAAAVNGGGGIDARAIPVDNSEAAVHGGGHIQLHVTKMLTAAVHGGGSIEYWGNPQVTSAIHGGGSVRQGH